MLSRATKNTRVARPPTYTPATVIRRFLSSSSSRFSISPLDTTSAPPASTASLLGDLSTLLRRYRLLDDAWNNRLHRAVADLQKNRNARVAVVGARESDVQGVVTALLDDPLSSNSDVTVTLEGRRLHQEAPEAIAIKYGEESSSSPSQVELPSSWLKDNKAELVEIVHADNLPPLSSSFSSLHLSDAVVLVLSDSALLSSKPAQTLLYNLAAKPNLFVALNASDASSPASSSPLRTLQHQLGTLLPSSSSTPDQPKPLVISTRQALAALEALSPAEPNQQPSYEAFQTGYLASAIPALSASLSTVLTAHSSSVSSPSPLQQQTASYILRTALHRSAFAGAQISDALASVSSSLSALSQQADESSLALLTSLGVDPSTGLLCVPEDEFEMSMKALEDLLLTRLAWYKLPYRTDDLHAEIALVVSQTFLPKFEDSLVFSAGRAVALSSTLSQRVDKLLSSPAFSAPSSSCPAAKLSSLYSPILLNRVAQAQVEADATASFTSSSTSTSTALSAPLSHRRSQITAPGGPTDRLHRRTQKALSASLTLTLSSLLGSAASQLLDYAELATNVGWGAMGVVGSAWWLQNRWEVGKKRFRTDLRQRIRGGIEEDLGLAARRLSDRALFKTRTAVALAEELVRQRQHDFDSFKSQLSAIEAERRALEEEEGQGTKDEA
ncbi:hypothetical protein JCM11641_003923 [Rhodosporidiobolus odoratus]